jgi:hypothetical protein
MGMTWATLMELLSFEFARLRKLPVVSFGFSSQPVTDPNALRAEEEKIAERLDLLIKTFARTRRWPALDEKEKYFLRERIRYAYEFAGMASLGARHPLTLAKRHHVLRAERRILEWILIDVWRDSGVHVWLDPFITLCSLGENPTPVWDLNLTE